MRLSKLTAPKPLSEVMDKEFDVSEMSDGYKRGMVLKVYKAKLKQLVGGDAIKPLLGDLQRASLSKKPYGNPTLYLKFRSGSPWKTEMHHRRYQLQMLLNKRLECEFIKEVRIR